MVEVVNRQRKLKVDLDRWKAFSERALEVVPAKSDGVTIAFVSDRAMSELNRMWRGKRGTTDVLSFPAEQDDFESVEGSSLGDVVISLEQAARQAKENRMKLDQEIAQLILHGMIHLCGYDHSADKGDMDRLELRLRKKLGI